LSVERYHALIRTSILTDDDAVELLEGWLVLKTPKSPPHRVVTGLTRETLPRVVPAGWFVNSHQPVTLEDSEPEPDVAVVRGEARHYADRHPGPQDVGLIVEVAESTLQRDQGLKKRLYARANIPVYWIVNLPEHQMEVYTDPTGPADDPDYRQRQNYALADDVPVVIDGREVGRLHVRDLMP
jgi:Uma2 family endonuclease